MKTVQLNTAHEIVRQLGGSRFVAMTGIKVFICSENYTKLTMQLPRNRANAKFVSVKLEPNDTYTVIFYRFVKSDVVEVANFSNVCNNELAAIFTQVTGLDTSL